VALAAAGLLATSMAEIPALMKAGLHLSPLWLGLWYVLQFLERPAARAGAGAQLLLLGAFAGVTGMLAGPLIGALIGTGAGAVVLKAFVIAVAVFGGLTGYVLLNKGDFSWMGGALSMAGMALLVIVCISYFAPFPTGLHLAIAAGLVVFAGALTLYETSNILHHYPTTMAPLAATRIYIAFFMLFWHILILLARSRD